MQLIATLCDDLLRWTIIFSFVSSKKVSSNQQGQRSFSPKMFLSESIKGDVFLVKEKAVVKLLIIVLNFH